MNNFNRFNKCFSVIISKNKMSHSECWWSLKCHYNWVFSSSLSGTNPFFEFYNWCILWLVDIMKRSITNCLSSPFWYLDFHTSHPRCRFLVPYFRFAFLSVFWSPFLVSSFWFALLSVFWSPFLVSSVRFALLSVFWSPWSSWLFGLLFIVIQLFFNLL